MSVVPDKETFAKPEILFRVPVGLSSPLWGLFAGAAVSGAAWWWMTRWARPENLEAMFGAAAKAEAALEPEIAALAAPEPVIEAAVEALKELEESESGAVAESVAEALPDGPLPVEPIGGGAAPISPVAEAVAAETIVPEADAAVNAAGEGAPAASMQKKKTAAPKPA